MENRRRVKAGLLAIGLILFVAISLLVTAYSYSGGSGVFPRFVGWIFVGLALVELSLQVGSFLSIPLSGVEEERVSPPGEGTVSREITGFLWIGFFLVSLYLAGFMVAIPLYVFSFLYLWARRKLWKCALVAASATISINVLFVQLMHFRLYPGILLGY